MFSANPALMIFKEDGTPSSPEIGNLAILTAVRRVSSTKSDHRAYLFRLNAR
jgi:hypothetical protein